MANADSSFQKFQMRIREACTKIQEAMESTLSQSQLTQSFDTELVNRTVKVLVFIKLLVHT